MKETEGIRGDDPGCLMGVRPANSEGHGTGSRWTPSISLDGSYLSLESMHGITLESSNAQ